jgi:hypothetical protein
MVLGCRPLRLRCCKWVRYLVQQGSEKTLGSNPPGWGNMGKTPDKLRGKMHHNGRMCLHAYELTDFVSNPPSGFVPQLAQALDRAIFTCQRTTLQIAFQTSSLNHFEGSQMSQKATVPCPHCGSTATYPVGVSNGSSPAYCSQCKQGFRIYMKNGSVDAVKKK